MSENTRPAMFTDAARHRLYEQRVLVLDGQLDDDNGTLLTSQLIGLATEDPGTDIALWIHSPGGSVPAMLAIRDVISLLPCDVSTLALGIACSRSEEHTSELQSRGQLVCRLLLEKKNIK